MPDNTYLDLGQIAKQSVQDHINDHDIERIDREQGKMREDISALLKCAATNQANIIALQEWQRQQNGSLTEIKRDVAAIRNNFDAMYKWILGALLAILLLIGGPLLVHVLG